ncbi:MAG: membrane protein insertase YidC [Rhodospirillales bacterium RIFCSPLOWO2_12_FULL_58_28]|nr:MAG: membrane protein insertase YidC [Rhodospirillales bacterium RIFCSPLOWO2_02_FULL_58_16]OHC79118.1 MAG: membrane protein insertase YidC [Rhodospirillales bacterium RIFCSPLOWO2_12_FULL_58_28]
MIDYRNIVLAIVLSVVILFGFEIYYGARHAPAPVETAPQSEQKAEAPASKAPQSSKEDQVPPTPGVASPIREPAVEKSREALLAAGQRVSIKSSRLHGSIALAGARIDDLTLADYHEDLAPSSPEIVVLTPQGSSKAYYAQFGWVAGAGVDAPGPETLWKADRDVLTEDSPVTMSWDNGKGLRFSRTYAIDADFMFTVTQRVENTGAESVDLYPFGLISRRSTPKVTGYIILHEGLLGVFNGTLAEVDYTEIKDAGTIKQSTVGGWIGITDKYWLAALVPDQKIPVNARFFHSLDGETDLYQVDYVGPQATVAPGASVKSVNGLFVGAKEAKLLDAYESQKGVSRFDLAIDFGWLYFLTKPIFYVLVFINEHVGNFGVSILLLTVVIKLLFFPLANKSYVAMSKMKKLQPEMLKLRERFGEDKTRLNQEMMALYKREKANPAAGCLPILIQIPVFFALYKVLFVTIEMRHAPFFGWIKDLSAPDPTTIFNLFGLLPFTPPDFLMIGVWPLIMGITMFLQQRLNPQPADQIQAKIFMFLPIMFTFLLAPFPAGLVIYWAWNNTLSIAQQWIIMRRMGVKA